ncbi:TPA: hypothetical protein JFW45_13375 [Legionella pneumophila]|nr:hypothetical protein [Legionella pneumophila]HAU1475639.1 hypothetical protein [Legionella pneumophila]HAV0409848.1 hypothetical protein [Legionella pneumophila]
MGLGSASSPRMLFVRAIQPQTWIVPCMPFWLELISFFSSSLLSMFISSSLTLTIPISLALFRMKLPDSCLPISKSTTFTCVNFSTLSFELRTPSLPITHVELGYYERNHKYSNSPVTKPINAFRSLTTHTIT